MDRSGERSQPDVERCRQRRGWLDRLRDWLRSRLEIDTRALAALRIALGLLILYDLGRRAGDLERYYTDAGVYPVAAYEATFNRYTGASIHALSGELWLQQLLFAVAAAFAVALVVGYRTRLVALVSLVLLVSLHARNPAVLNGGDRLLRVLVLVALLTPLGERWSIDALRRGAARRRVASLGTVALLVQPIVVFTANAIRKREGDSWLAGDALEIAMANDVMTVHLGNHLVAYPGLLTVLTWAWMVLLAGSVPFLLCTGGRLRAAFALSYLGAFSGMLATVAVGLFPFVLAASVLPFLTAPFWDALARLRPVRPSDAGRIATRLGPLARPPVERRTLASLSNRGYDRHVASVRAFGRSALTIAAALVLVWILLYSTANLAVADVPDEVYAPQLDEQRWGLYAPDPSTSYSWYVVEAETASGATVDAVDGGPVQIDRPPDASREYDDVRDRKFMETVRDASRGDVDPIVVTSYAAWACDRAAERLDELVERVTVERLIQPGPIEEFETLNSQTIADHRC